MKNSERESFVLWKRKKEEVCFEGNSRTDGSLYYVVGVLMRRGCMIGLLTKFGATLPS